MPPRRRRPAAAPAAVGPSSPPPPPPIVNLDDYFPELDGKKIRVDGQLYRMLKIADGTYIVTKEIPVDQVEEMEEFLEYTSPYNPNNADAAYPNEGIFASQKGTSAAANSEKSYCGSAQHIRRALMLQMMHDKFYPDHQFRQPFRSYGQLGLSGSCFAKGRSLGSALRSGGGNGSQQQKLQQKLHQRSQPRQNPRQKLWQSIYWSRTQAQQSLLSHLSIE